MHTVILAGGGSRRMGRDKALLPWAGGTLLQSQIDRFAPLGPVAVCLDRPSRFSFSGAAELADPFPGQGPLNGLVSGLRWSGGRAIFLCAVDLPYADPAWATRLYTSLDGYDACLLRSENGPEPLFAAYTPTCLDAAEASLRQGRLRMRGLLDTLRVRYFDAASLPALHNVNTPEDFTALA